MAEVAKVKLAGFTHRRADEAAFAPTDGYAAAAPLMNQGGPAQPAPFPQLLQSSRQPLADALGLFVGVVDVRRGGHDFTPESPSPHAREHQ